MMHRNHTALPLGIFSINLKQVVDEEIIVHNGSLNMEFLIILELE